MYFGFGTFKGSFKDYLLLFLGNKLNLICFLVYKIYVQPIIILMAICLDFGKAD